MNPEFKKILDDIARVKKQNELGEIALSEFLKQREDSSKDQKEDEGKTYEESKLARKERYMKRADIQESLLIAADLAIMKGSGVVVTKAANDSSKVEEAKKKSLAN